MDDLADELDTLAKTVPDHLKGVARRLGKEWREGVSPSRVRLEQLRESVRPNPPCVRPDFLGGCEWLRRHGAASGLPVPPVGDRALCCFTDQPQDRCPGYRKDL